MQIAARTSTAAPGACDEVLFGRLRQLRNDLARKQAQPAYVVFADVSLQQMAREYPTTAGAFSRISGVGQKKLEEFGAVFMREIEDYLQSNAAQTFDTRTERAPARKPLGDSECETLRRFRSGQSIERIARERGIKESTALGHLGAAADCGEELEIERFVTDERRAEIDAAFEKVGWANLTGAHDLLGGRYDFAVLRIYRAHRRAQEGAPSRSSFETPATNVGQ